ncbi:Ppx/GppA phosphatase family protein [Pseudoalteromonas phenolica]|uniref:Exopolyphosphatase n=2 Tax=Pseudoalteromonas phenolica TaxID=161398 RepID=A0A0S2JXX9_9GAMM|nr:exopolyphosphatase [Pseudoalteromonas phenolica]ALO41002.1 Exopolyphosphatase [Pseudoalteromonas phenolica]MBE0354476.1 exopolyphosphatase / guanosine-5'-triphosphate,3'-diphosphate pyrophosphatase [Pseudoalteromonas phenolica O-BC30]
MHNTPEPASFAALDLGSNSFHLVIARKVEGRLQILHKEKHRVHLAAGLNEEFELSEEAIERAMLAFKQLAQTLQGFDPANVEVVATYTLRNIKNLKHFLQQAQVHFPFNINVISGQEEARLIYQGVANYVHGKDNRLVIDIGGGSTELVIGQHFEALQLTSRDIGCANITKACFSSGKLSKGTFKKAEIAARQALEPISPRYRKTGWKHSYGTSGTIKALIGIAQAQFDCEYLTLPILEDIKALFIAQGSIEQLDIKGLNPERHTNIAGGLSIVIAAFKELKLDRLEYCDYALREGVLHEMLNYDEFDLRVRTIIALGQHYNIDTAHADNVFDTVKHLFSQCKKAWGLKQKDLLQLQWAAQLHEVGLSINSSGIQKHSAYIVMNTALPGFTQQQQSVLSALIRFHRKKIKLPELDIFNILCSETFAKLLTLFRLAVLVNRTRQLTDLSRPTLSVEDNKCTVLFDAQLPEEQALLCADLEQEKLYLDSIGIELVFVIGECS